MVSNIEFKYNGKVYQAVPEIQEGGCKGCAFDLSDDGCIEAIKNYSCNNSRVIWKEKSDPSILTWTEQEIREAYAGWSGTLEDFIKILKKNKDPDYQTSLELKAKFGATA